MTNLSEASEILLSAGDAEPVAEFLKNLCHPHRLMIVCALVEGELGVGDLVPEWSERVVVQIAIVTVAGEFLGIINAL